MASLAARLFGGFLRMTGSVTRQFAGGPGMDGVIATARAAPVPVPTAKMHRQMVVTQDEFAGRAVWHLSPRGAPPSGHLLYFHGGGYVFTAAPPHWSMLANLVSQHGIAITAPLYPLAPESCAQDVVDFALGLYRQFLATHDGPFVVGGDSAGGGLAVATLMAARDAGLRMPSNLLLICPWLDASASHPDQPGIEPRDCILRLRGLRDAGALYARTLPVSDWRVSPINGDWAGLPPILMFAGGDDILVTDARTLKSRMPAIEYDERAGLMHDWPLFFFSESRDAHARMGAFIAAAT
ncbi:MAG: alpha/beta hydrolase fold domain-containing protein [Sphingopyxis sp.]